jgi:elongator complex protein 2
VSGADDHTLRLWKLGPNGSQSCLQVLEEHSAAINCISAIALTGRDGSQRTLVASGAADASIKLWSVESEKLVLQQTITTTPKFFPLSLALHGLGHGGIVLAAGGTKETIQIFVADGQAALHCFRLQATLSGHQGWIRCLHFCSEDSTPDSDVLLASASQDKYIRLWRFRRGKELPSAAAGSNPTLGAFLPGKSPSNKAHSLQGGDQVFTVTFEALLLGHEDWVYSARWHRSEAGSLRLLSSSADNSLAIWEADPRSGIWVSAARFGELSKEKGSTTATGSIGGFWTGLWSPNGSSVVCLSKTGSWRRWEYDQARDQWVQRIAVTGHTKAITGISWSQDGTYLLSTSLDQTTRLHAQWKRKGNGAVLSTWHEVARPQIHGYDLNCIDALGSTMFISGADEKLMRVFSEPKSVARLVGRLTGSVQTPAQVDTLLDAADMPALGLSNKAVDAPANPSLEAGGMETQEGAVTQALQASRASALDFDHPPFEDSLSRLTLWPETEKLYGHGYEISCLAASHDGKLLASACRATSLNHAVIRVFETERWTELKPPLAAHTLTATRLRFSADDRYLLSVGRDRQWAVFERIEKTSFKLRQSHAKGHARMILDAAWAPFEEARVFATAGRDKQVKFWLDSSSSDVGSVPTEFGLAHSTNFPDPVTALDFLPKMLTPEAAILAVGTEAGALEIMSVNSQSGLQVISLLRLPDQ